MVTIRIKDCRGSREDVMQRFSEALSQNNWMHFCEYVAIVHYYNLSYLRGNKVYKINNFDLVTNVFPRSFPSGMR